MIDEQHMNVTGNDPHGAVCGVCTGAYGLS